LLNVEGILLAAGESRRMGYPKPLLKIGERTFLGHLSELMLRSVSRLVIVVGANAQAVARAVPEDPRVVTAENREYARGQLSSLQTGLARVGAETRAVTVHLVDHPTVRAETFANLIAEYERTGKPIVIARHRGRRGHPVLFDRAVFRELFDAPPERGALAVVNADPSRVGFLDVDDPGIVLDLDTPADLAGAGLPFPPR
jgi:molybdenum cofactor cytidylyltransferase